MRRWRWWVGVAALLGLTAWVVSRPVVLRAIGAFPIVVDAPISADVIVVLAGSVPDRMMGAADLYLQGWAKRIVVVEETTRPGIEALRARGADIPATHDLNRSVAEQLGVPAAAIEVLGGAANSTMSEAQIVLADLRRHQAREILLVTSKIHSYRAQHIYQRLAGPTMHFTSCPTPYDPYDPDTWWRSRGQARRLFFEYQKILFFWLRDFWWGVGPTSDVHP